MKRKIYQQIEYKNYRLLAYERSDGDWDVVIKKDKKLYKDFVVLGYKLWTVMAHFSDMVEHDLSESQNQTENEDKSTGVRMSRI